MVSLLAFQLTRQTSVGDRHTMAVNLQNLDEEIKLIEQVSQEVLTHLQIDTSIVGNPLSAPVSALPQRLRDPFIFPGELITAKKAAVASKTVSSISPQKSNKKPPEPKQEIKLSGIIYDTLNPMAIINGNIYRTSDRINEYTITSISLQGVRLVSPKERLFLPAPVIE